MAGFCPALQRWCGMLALIQIKFPQALLRKYKSK
jgi:hypothetical protein